MCRWPRLQSLQKVSIEQRCCSVFYLQMKLSVLLLLFLLPLSSAAPLDLRDNTVQRNGKNT